MKIAISAESTIDMPQELLNEFDIHTVPFTILLGDKTGLDGKITSSEIIEYVKENKVLPKTSAVNEHQYNEHFSKLLSNYDAVIHFSLSSGLSSAYENAVASAKNFKNIYVVDTLSLSTGIALLAIYARKLARKNVAPERIFELCNIRKKDLQVSFVLKRLDFLYKGGRCSSLQLLGANLLQLRPEILVEDGKMHSSKKFRGNMDVCVTKYCEDILQRFSTPDKSEVFVTYTTATKEMLDNATKCLKNAGFENIHYTTAGGTITSHCGEFCLGILYINSEEPKI